MPLPTYIGERRICNRVVPSVILSVMARGIMSYLSSVLCFFDGLWNC